MMPLPAHEKIDRQWGESPSRVLIVDDEPLIRWSLAAGLRLGGFDAVAASSPSEAVVLAGACPHPDAILVDLDLFDASPAALLTDLKSAAPDCWFFLMTTGEQDRFSAVPNTRVIRKPFDLGDVVRLVRSLLDASSIRPATAAAEPVETSELVAGPLNGLINDQDSAQPTPRQLGKPARNLTYYPRSPAEKTPGKSCTSCKNSCK